MYTNRQYKLFAHAHEHSHHHGHGAHEKRRNNILIANFHLSNLI